MFKTVLAAAAVMLASTYAATDALRKKIIGRDDHAAAVSKTEEVRPGSVSLRVSPDGHFRVDASIGGRTVPMLIDTGATVVALSHEHGKALGLISGADSYDARVSTANGSVAAKLVVLRDVRIGSVRVEDVMAVVLSPGAMDGALLGMSFLGRLRRLETARDKMVMER